MEITSVESDIIDTIYHGMTTKEASRLLGAKTDIVLSRLKRGIPIEDAFTMRRCVKPKQHRSITFNSIDVLILFLRYQGQCTSTICSSLGMEHKKLSVRENVLYTNIRRVLKSKNINL